MADLIQRLPDIIANQIAAGEVVQRPASVVKELLENSIDAGCTSIALLVEEGGRTLIQIVDNGCGMSEVDARMCFERHATSKIQTTEDLFSIRTMGFRGEALASIAAISQIEIKSKLTDKTIGTQVNIDGGIFLKQEPTVCSNGTVISVKNLFYNIPARRKFLKNDAVEFRYIAEEFERIALAHPKVAMMLIHNDKEIYNLGTANLGFRIAAVLGNTYKEKIVPIEEETDLLGISGFLIKPEYSKKTRGEQYIFLNKRFIKSPYLHNAVLNAYNDIAQSDNHPGYFLFLDIDPQHIDINIHPTKTEVKFENDKLIYAFLSAAIKKVLAGFVTAPALDFNNQADIAMPFPNSTPSDYTPSYNTSSYSPSSHQIKKSSIDQVQQQQWLERVAPEFEQEGAFAFTQTIEEVNKEVGFATTATQSFASTTENTATNKEISEPYQIHNTFLLQQIFSGILLVHQQYASERILYEDAKKALLGTAIIPNQALLFPIEISISPADSLVIQEILQPIQTIGFLLQLKNNVLEVSACPSFLSESFVISTIVDIIENYKQHESVGDSVQERLALSYAKNCSLKIGKKLSVPEMSQLIDKLFACEVPYISPLGKTIVSKIKLAELEQKFL